MRCLILVSALILSALTSANCQEQEPKLQKSAKDSVTINVTLDKELVNYDKWFFLVTLEKSEYSILDSCFVATGVDAFTLRSYFPFENLTFAELLWDAGNVRMVRLDLMATDYVSLHINNSLVHRITGSPASELINKYKDIAIKDKKTFNAQHDSISSLNLDAAQYHDATHKLDSSFKVLKISRMKAEVLEEFIPSNCIITIKLLEDWGVEPSELDLLIEATKKRFPSDSNVINFATSRALLKTGLRGGDKGTVKYSQNDANYPDRVSANSRRVQHRIKQILDWGNKTTSSAKLQIGDTLSDFTLKSIDGGVGALASIKSDYVFIDFWAGWCAPCRREIPFIKDAAAKYGDQLTIIAISLDYNEDEWKQAIEADKSQMFTHLYLGNENKEAEVFRNQFGIKGIPANFLIDRNRKIIDVNLRGTALDTKLSELLKGGN